MKIKYKKNYGFSLVEMIISIAILGMIMTPIYTMLIVSQRTNKDGENKQTAALHGQEILEEIKSLDAVEKVDEEGNVTEIQIGDIIIPASEKEVIKEIEGKDYKVIVTVGKNTSRKLEENASSEEGIKTVDFKGVFSQEVIEDLSSLKVDLSNSINSDNIKGSINFTNQDEVLKLSVSTKTIDNRKIIDIRDKFNNYIITPYEVEIEESNINNQINLVLNFDEYKVKSGNVADSSELRPLDVSVYNHDNVPLNISLQKSAGLDANINTKLGNVRVFNNRSSSSEASEWYDIKVEATQTINGESKTIFTEQTSQKIKVIQEVVK